MTDLFRTRTATKPVSGHPRWLTTLLLLVAVVCGGCQNEGTEGDQRAKRKAPVLTDESMERLLGAIKDLKDLRIAQETARAIAEGVEDPHIHPEVGVGMSEFVKDSGPILKRWGFRDAIEFEGLHSYAVLALQQVVLGQDTGVQQASKRYQIQRSLEAHRQRIAAAEADQSLSKAERQKRITDAEFQITELEDTLQEDEDNAALMIGQNKSLPPENVIVMQKYLEQYMALKRPHG